MIRRNDGKLVVDEVALDEWKQAYDAASVCWKKTPMIYSMSVGMFSIKTGKWG